MAAPGGLASPPRETTALPLIYESVPTGSSGEKWIGHPRRPPGATGQNVQVRCSDLFPRSDRVALRTEYALARRSEALESSARQKPALLGQGSYNVTKRVKCPIEAFTVI